MQDERMAGLVADQHARIRELFHDAATASVEQRADACARLVRFLAVHEAAEQVALHPHASRWPEPVEDEVRELAHRTERLEDLGPRSSTYAVQLGLVAAVVDHHVRLGESEEVPRFVGTAADADVDRALDALRVVPDLVAEEGAGARVPTGASFAAQLRAARQVVSTPASDAGTARHIGRIRRDGPLRRTGRADARRPDPQVSRRRAGQ